MAARKNDPLQHLVDNPSDPRIKAAASIAFSGADLDTITGAMKQPHGGRMAYVMQTREVNRMAAVNWMHCKRKAFRRELALSDTGRVCKAFNTSEAAALAGVKRTTLTFWKSTGLLEPSIMNEPRRVRYSFNDLLAARVIHKLRSQDISLQNIRKIAVQIAGVDQAHPLAGRILIVKDGDVYEKDAGAYYSLLKSQAIQAFPFMVEIDSERETLISDIEKATIGRAYRVA